MGGVYDGLTAGGFHRWCNGKYARIYGFEANPYVLAKCEKYYRDNLHDAVIIRKGLWNEKTNLSFTGGYSGASRVSAEGDTSIETDTIDHVLNGEKVSFIKMDIEGAEYNALVGGRKTIEKYKPHMALSVYHKPWDIIEIPELLLDINKDYRFAMRQYASIGDETVLYAFEED